MASTTIRLRHEWILEDEAAQPYSLSDVLSLLHAIEQLGNISAACKHCNMSYRHAWGVLRQCEVLMGSPLLHTQRRKGTSLSEFAKRIIWADKRIDARLRPTLASLSSELQEDLQRLLPDKVPSLRLHASHGFAVESLTKHMNDHDNPLELRYRSSSEALAALVNDECDLAGFQVPIGKYEASLWSYYSQWLDASSHILVHLAVRNMGFFIQSGNPKKISGVYDLARPDLRFVNRQAGSGTRFLTELLLLQYDIDKNRVNGFEDSEFTHMAIAAHIASGMADLGIGVETAAVRFGLDFIPLLKERYFFAVHKSSLNLPEMQKIIAYMRSPEFALNVKQLEGYDTSDIGNIVEIPELFNV